VGASGKWVDRRKGRMRVYMVFVSIYESRRMKSVEIVPSRGKERE
jgi:hypothetical protein